MSAFADQEDDEAPPSGMAAGIDWRDAHRQLERQMRERTAELLEANQRLSASQQQLRHLAAYQEQVREDERKRIAREIHDDLGQNMLALRIDVLRLQARTANRHPALNQRVVAALAQIDSTIKSVRGIINNLRPPALDLGLQAAIEWQLRDFRRRSGLACDLAAAGGEFDAALDEGRALALFRILQESLSNVARHAGASRVEIELRRDGGGLCMTVRDDGVGMDPATARKPDSFGLLGIRERVGYLQGELTIDSAPGRGTALTVSIPLAATAADS